MIVANKIVFTVTATEDETDDMEAGKYPLHVQYGNTQVLEAVTSTKVQAREMQQDLQRASTFKFVFL